MSRTKSPSTGTPYGLARVLGACGVPRSTYYWQRTRRHNPLEARKRGPKTAFSDKELTERLRKEIAASPFTGEGQRKFWARLRIAGVRTSKARVLRLMRDAQMRDAQMLAPQRQAAPVAEKVHTGTIVTEHPNQMWGIDATATVTIEEDQVTVFAAVDHCTAECVGIHAVKRATRFEALDPIRQGVNEHFGGFHAHGATGLQLRHDHGSQFMSDDFQNEIRSLEIEFSPAFVREPEGNGCIERFFQNAQGTIALGSPLSVPYRNWFTPFRSSRSLQPTLVDRARWISISGSRRENVLRSNPLLDYNGLVLSNKSGAQHRVGAGRLAATASSRRSEASPRAAVTRAPVYCIGRQLCPKKLI